MARITEAALDGSELARLKADRSQRRSPVGRAPIHLAPVAPIASLVLIVGGSGAILAPGPLPFPVDLLGMAALVLGGWLAGRRDDGDGQSRDALVEGIVGATLIERRDLIRAAIALAAVRGDDAAARRAGSAVAGPPAGEPDPTGGDGPGAGRPVLHAVERPGADASETLDPGADADAL